MNTSTTETSAPRDFELRYRSLFDQGRGLSFPCDAEGRVAIDDMSERARFNYYFARKAIGREFATPAIRLVALH